MGGFQGRVIVNFLVGQAFLLTGAVGALGQIRIPDDAPQPLSPAESASTVSLPEGYSLELLAAEPLIRNPSGVCWNEHGHLFVCELHGYNAEGQYDIEELNKTGKLDRVVRRIPAPPEAIERAEQDQVGSVKRLIDTDGDGVMDQSEVWADDLPPCFGVVPERDGIIVVCAPDILFLADRDGDGVAEIRETLFTGFKTGVLERRMSAPQWGPDHWIYVAAGGGTITGPHLKSSVTLPNNDFRFKADGSAIEPLTASSWTFGFTFSNSGDRYVISTGTPAIYVAPLPWRYLARNPHVGYAAMTIDVGPGQATYPTSQPHPWRSRRANDPGFEELYRTRYGAAESAPNGFFTSACSPFVYKDTALPLAGQLLACEPAQNMIHRSQITRAGLVPKLVRPDTEENSEFLASRDIWFHPIALSHAPDGAVVIADFYREIIEDYSAIPRYLQQEYQLKHGENHGRLWRLVHEDMPKPQPVDMTALRTPALVAELASPRFWRRQTACRLLLERDDHSAVADLQSLVATEGNPTTTIAALHLIDAMEELSENDLVKALQHPDPSVIVVALRLADQRFEGQPALLEQSLSLLRHSDPRVLIQLALSLGESADPRAKQALATLAVDSIGIRWMDDAILSSLNDGASHVIRSISSQTGDNELAEPLARFLTRTCRMIADSRDDAALAPALTIALESTANTGYQIALLEGLAEGLSVRRKVDLPTVLRHTLQLSLLLEDQQVAALAQELVIAMKAETDSQRLSRLKNTTQRVIDVQLDVGQRIDAVKELAAEDDAASLRFLLGVMNQSTPTVRAAILQAAFARTENQPMVWDAVTRGTLPASALSAIQRDAFLHHADASIRQQAQNLFQEDNAGDAEMSLQYFQALNGPRDLPNGQSVFQKLCSNCHKIGDLGYAVGPDLLSEFRRSEETFIQDILFPAAKITQGYESYVVQTVDGSFVSGLISAESPTSITLRKEEGKKQTLLRKDIEAIRVSGVSLMPDDLSKALRPTDVADLIGWLRSVKRWLAAFNPMAFSSQARQIQPPFSWSNNVT